MTSLSPLRSDQDGEESRAKWAKTSTKSHLLRLWAKNSGRGHDPVRVLLIYTRVVCAPMVEARFSRATNRPMMRIDKHYLRYLAGYVSNTTQLPAKLPCSCGSHQTTRLYGVSEECVRVLTHIIVDDDVGGVRGSPGKRVTCNSTFPMRLST